MRVSARSTVNARSSAELLLVALACAAGGALVPGVRAEAPGAHIEANPFFARTWLIEDGLPNNVVNRVVQDAHGFLWVATAGGVARFDGREFREFPLPDLPPDVGVSVRDIAVEDASTLVLLAPTGGVLRLRDGTFSEHPVSRWVAGKVLLDLYAAPDGALWAAATDSTVVRWHEGAVQQFGPADGIQRQRHSYSFASDKQGRVWIGVADYLGVFADGRLTRHPEPIGPAIHISAARAGGLWVSSNRLLRLQDGTLTEVCDRDTWSRYPGLREVLEDIRGGVWLATSRDGLFRFAGGRITPVPGSYDVVNRIMRDAEENIWVATSGGGLTRLRPNVFTMLDRRTGLPDDISTSVCLDPAGALWCANRSGGVIRIVQGRLERIERADGGVAPYANTVCLDQQGNVWAGAIQGLFRTAADAAAPRLESVAADLTEVQVLHHSQAGDMWVGSGDSRLGYFRDGVYHALRAADGYSERRVKSIAEDRAGGIWIATDDRHVFFWDGRRVVPRFTSDILPGGLIYSLMFDDAGALWLATSRGLVRAHDSRFDCFTTQHGLPDDNISQIIPDGAGNFWCGSQRGLFSVPLAQLDAVARGERARLAVRTLGRDEGLIGASALNNMHPKNARGPDGTLWFGTHAGLVGIHPVDALPPRLPPRIHLDGVTVDGRPVPRLPGLRVRAAARQIEIRLAVLHFAAPEKVRLRYRLAGFDTEWSEAADARTIVFGQLAPGTYTLRAVAGNQDGAWSEEEATLAFVVLPEWWQTWWARGTALLVFTTLIFLVARGWSHRRLRRRLERLEREHALEQERARIARDLHDELGGSLTQIGLLADRLRRHWERADTPAALQEMTQRMRQLTRELDSMVWTISPKNDRWNALARFVGRYAQRFFREAEIACTVDGVETIPEAALAPEVQHQLLAVVKEVLHNILKHAHARRVSITWSHTDGQVYLRIRDDGCGFDPAAQEHAERNGLNNMRSRIAELGGEIQISSRPGEGTEIALTVSLDAKPQSSPGPEWTLTSPRTR